MSSCWLTAEDATPVVESVRLSLVGSPAELYPTLPALIPGRPTPARLPARLYSDVSLDPSANCFVFCNPVFASKAHEVFSTPEPFSTPEVYVVRLLSWPVLLTSYPKPAAM